MQWITLTRLSYPIRTCNTLWISVQSSIRVWILHTFLHTKPMYLTSSTLTQYLTIHSILICVACINPLNAEFNPICHLLILLGDLTFMGPCIVSIFQYISNKMQRYTAYLYLETAYMFRVVLPPIIRSAYNCIYSIWYK